MPKVICTLEHASDLINGIRFIPHAEGKVSEEIEQETHDYFLSIPGFKKHEKLKAKPDQVDVPKGAAPEVKKPVEEQKSEEKSDSGDEKEVAKNDEQSQVDDDPAKSTDTPAQIDAKAARKAEREAAALAAAAGK